MDPQGHLGKCLGIDVRAQRRTFVLPLSPLIHAPAFGDLPAPLRERVLRRLATVFERGVPPGAVRMTREGRLAVRDHLRATIADWPRRQR